MVDEALFARYQRALGANADLCHKAVEEMLAAVVGLPPRRQSQALVEEYARIVRRYGQVAAEVARQYYQDSRDLHFEGDEEAEPYEATVAPPVDARWAAEDVRKYAPPELPGVASRRTMQRADQTLSLNLSRDPARGRWAIIPHPGACGWCLMVASNGWGYSRESVNAQRHTNCKCAVAVDFDRDKPGLAGYDPDALRRAYADARGAIEADAERHWAAMSDAERAEYARPRRSAHDVYLSKRIADELGRRDETWARTGSPSYRTREPGARPLKKGAGCRNGPTHARD